jgi:hypothetical protein
LHSFTFNADAAIQKTITNKRGEGVPTVLIDPSTAPEYPVSQYHSIKAGDTEPRVVAC